MKIDNLKQLQKVIQLCQKAGVTAIKIDGIEMAISPKPIQRKRYTPVDLGQPAEADIAVPQYTPLTENPAMDSIDTPDELTEEQLMFYSVGETANQ